jgi:hypothetical protein
VDDPPGMAGRPSRGETSTMVAGEPFFFKGVVGLSYENDHTKHIPFQMVQLRPYCLISDKGASADAQFLDGLRFVG